MGSYYAGMKNASGGPYLRHYGIEGMHWGVRRFQNEDRTWTDAGKLRYEQWATKRIYGGSESRRASAEAEMRRTQAKAQAERQKNIEEGERIAAQRKAQAEAEKAQKKAEAEAEQKKLQDACSAIENAASSAHYENTQKKLAKIANKLAAGKITIEEAMKQANEALAKDDARWQKAVARENARRQKLLALQQKQQKREKPHTLKMTVHGKGDALSLARKGGGGRRRS